MSCVEELEKNKNDQEQAKYNSTLVGNPVLKGIASLFPFFGDVVTETIRMNFIDFQDEKMNELKDMILSEGEIITSKMVNDVEFVMNAIKTADMVNRLARNDKVKYFGSLLKNGYLTEDKILNDEFDEYFDILNRLSNREISVVIQLYRFQKVDKFDANIDEVGQSPLYMNWNEHEKICIETLNSDIETFKTILIKLEGMGIFSKFNTWGTVKGEIKGYITPYFMRFADRISDE